MGGLNTGEDFRVWHTESKDLNQDDYGKDINRRTKTSKEGQDGSKEDS